MINTIKSQGKGDDMWLMKHYSLEYAAVTYHNHCTTHQKKEVKETLMCNNNRKMAICGKI